MKNSNVEDLYMTPTEVCTYLGISRARVTQLTKAGMIRKLKGAMYETASVEAYKLKRGDKKGGRYPKNSEADA